MAAMAGKRGVAQRCRPVGMKVRRRVSYISEDGEGTWEGWKGRSRAVEIECPSVGVARYALAGEIYSGEESGPSIVFQSRRAARPGDKRATGAESTMVGLSEAKTQTADDVMLRRGGHERARRDEVRMEASRKKRSTCHEIHKIGT